MCTRGRWANYARRKSTALALDIDSLSMMVADIMHATAYARRGTAPHPSIPGFLRYF